MSAQLTALTGLRVIGSTDQLRTHPLRLVMSALMVLWIVYMATNFRSPFTPIIVSDANASSAVRQAIFGAASLTAFSLLFFTRNIGRIIALNLPICGLAALVLSSTLWSTDTALTFKRSALFLCSLIALLVTVHMQTKPTQGMLKLVVTTTTLIGLISLALHAALPSDYTVNPGRPGLAGIAVHPNTLAPFLSIGLILSFGLTATTRLNIRIAQVILGTALILTASITTWMSTALGVGLFCLLSAPSYRRGLLQITVVAGLAIGSLIGWGTLKQSAFDITGRDASLSGRDSLWSIVLNEGSKHPIIGQGYGAFWTEGKGRELVQTWNPRQSHNAYLDLWLDLGLVGIIAVLVCIHGTLYCYWKAVRGPSDSPQRMAIAALYACSLSYLFSYAFAQSFFLRFDSFPFLIIAWSILLITNRDANGLTNEFNTTQS